MFVPRCCAPLANIRRYEPDGSGTIIAERANEFWRGNGRRTDDVPIEIYGASHGIVKPFSVAANGYLWVYYHAPARDAAGYQVRSSGGAFSMTVAKRYSLDLAQETTYSYTVTGITGDLSGGLETFVAQHSFDGIAPLSDGGIAAVTGHRQTSQFGPYEFSLRCWNADGTTRWTLGNPSAPLADGRIVSCHPALSGNVWMVWQQSVEGGIEPGDPPPPPSRTLEVYADLRSGTTGALITRVVLQSLHQEIQFPYDVANIPWFISCTDGGRLVVVANSIKYLASIDSTAGPDHLRAAVVAADASGFSWFRLRRPSTAGSTTAVAGFEAIAPNGELNYCIVPRTTKGNLGLGLWIHAVNDLQFGTPPIAYQRQWWQWSLDGNFLQEYDLNEITTGQNNQTVTRWKIPTMVTRFFPYTTTQAAHDENGALLYVRRRDVRLGFFDKVEEGIGTVRKIRDNLDPAWESPDFNQILVTITDVVGQTDTYTSAACWADGVSIAYDQTDAESSYFLVAARAF